MKKLVGLVLGLGVLWTAPALANCSYSANAPALQAGTGPCSMDLSGNLRVLTSGGTAGTPTIVAGATTNAPASITNPLPVNATPTVAFAACASSTVVTGGTSQSVIGANTIVHGALITNPATATEPLFINTTAGASTTVGGTNFALAIGASFSVPGPDAVAITGTSTTSAHVFNCVRW